MMGSIRPPGGGEDGNEGDPQTGARRRREPAMRLAKRIAMSLGTLLAIALAGGAHYKL
jgi:hypothetical protein